MLKYISYEPTIDPFAVESWKMIPGYEGNYWASDLGRIKGRVKVLRFQISPVAGYPYVTLHKNGKSKTFLVHHLIAYTFLGPRPPGYVIDHVGGKKLDIRAVKLEYVTHAENEQRAATLGLKASGKRNGHYTCPERTPRGVTHSRALHPQHSQGERNPRAKLRDCYIPKIRSLRAVGLTQQRIADIFRVGQTQISRIELGRRWTK